jgi:hypothetical protein
MKAFPPLDRLPDDPAGDTARIVGVPPPGHESFRTILE